ncbi:flagellar M-ring protein FliF [Chelativorans sp. ZYF759]|uniref:flagellar basal-body MS-ring/collar protein FliF n=1 Tax=Chelativorans sp. ZYF759 TaxID=2692213 RepID=UPI00145F8B37|nr:flagellar basal-body MS-ring/collar protein FliF [Chelativorans sp. ZYF759]NMG40331.1 flagellar M-ring protein FliF [Chelativorans sp. ZYF759]
MPEQLKTVIDNLSGLGPKRLGIMGAIGATVLVVIIAASIYLNRPGFETLYVGLDRSDVNQIGLVLGESGIDTEVGSDGSSIMVPVGRSAAARTILAERGLPASSNAGYELFDEVGSFGLTSFMQQVTRVRALEGEIARTIQSMANVRGARVHIVMSDRGSFRTAEQEPSASVVIRMAGGEPVRTANAIRHMVSAAVPGLNSERVTVLDSSGTLLAAGDDPANNAANRAIGVERTVEVQVEENIRRALAPYLGYDNFRASVRAEVNTDARQIEETIFDPDSRVERSVQVVRSNDQANQRQAAPPVTVQQNLPDEAPGAGEGAESTEQRERREETTNYELNTTRIATISNGYSVNKLSVAVVVNRERLASLVGVDGTAEQLQGRIDEIRAMVTSAAGFSEARGDVVHVSAVEFMEGLEGVDAAAPGVTDLLSRHIGTLINATAFVLVVFLVTWFGLRPLTTVLVGRADNDNQATAEEMQRSLPNPADTPALPNLLGGSQLAGAPGDDFESRIKPAPQERLARMVDLNEERTASILRKWAHKEAA